MQNSVISTRITCLYGYQPWSVIFACKTASFGPELQVSMGPRPHLSFCACKIAWFASEWQVYIGSSLHLWFCSYKTGTLGPDLRICMGPKPHLWFWAHIAACLALEFSRLYGFQHSLVVLCMKNRDFRTRITSLCGYQKRPVVLYMCNGQTVIASRTLTP